MLDNGFDRMVDRMCDLVAVSHMVQTMIIHTFESSPRHWTTSHSSVWTSKQAPITTFSLPLREPSLLFSVFDKVGDPKKMIPADSLPGVQGHTYALFKRLRWDTGIPTNLAVVFVGKDPSHRVVAPLAAPGNVS
jgi:hypothetical protein